MSEAIFHGHHDVPVNRHATAWRGFVIAVAIATVLPFIVAPLTEQVIPKGTPGFLLFALINFLGTNVHVATTGWFYTDPAMRTHFRAHPARYIIGPLLLVSTTSVAFVMLDLTSLTYFLVAYTSWLLWHYQKQNVGLLSFIAAGTHSPPLSLWERRTLMLASLPGILGVFSVTTIAPEGWTSRTVQQLYHVGLAIYGPVAVAFCIAMFATPALRRNRLRLAFFLATTLFFLPTYLFSSQIAANGSYAVAHGLQYLVFMSVVSIDRQNVRTTLLRLLVFAVMGGIFLDKAMLAAGWLAGPGGMALLGAFYGLVMSHFVLDAGIWRLREPFQRSYMRRKFAFIFAR